MVNILTGNQIKRLSPELRVKNSYEALYYQVNSGDPEMDDIVKEKIQESFVRHNVTLADNPSRDTLRDVMVDAYKESAKELGVNVRLGQEGRLEKDFDTFAKNHSSFYETSFKAYETKYQGEPVDFAADYNRVVRDNGGVRPIDPSMTDAELLAPTLGASVSARVQRNRAGLSYSGHVPEAAAQTTRRAYQQRKQDEMDEFDRQVSQQESTPDNEFSFTEHEYEVDNGPEY